MTQDQIEIHSHERPKEHSDKIRSIYEYAEGLDYSKKVDFLIHINNLAINLLRPKQKYLEYIEIAKKYWRGEIQEDEFKHYKIHKLPNIDGKIGFHRDHPDVIRHNALFGIYWRGIDVANRVTIRGISNISKSSLEDLYNSFLYFKHNFI